MIIMTCRYGLANRLFYYAHCVALGEASGHTVFSSNLPESGAYFGGNHGAFCVWPKSAFPRIPWPNRVRRAFNIVFRFAVDIWRKYNLPGPKFVLVHVDETDKVTAVNPEFLEMLRSHWLVIMMGWPAINKIVLPNPETIRTFFAPRPELAEAARDVARKAKGDADILIGIHFRWGDYSHYGNGCFYFSIEVYLRVMRRCLELFPGQRVAFLGASNEPDILRHTFDLFAPLKLTLAPNNLVGDLLSLAECDYIISPASSFSLWSAFIGRKPIWCMESEYILPELKDFVICDTSFAGMHPEGIHKVAAAARATAEQAAAPLSDSRPT